ncbi:MAG: hypothetical protein M1833_003276 [Piccolia ochrophora]|nr:MAG: hypothetical protein M1833_003276 [Piccolia ochrophora]
MPKEGSTQAQDVDLGKELDVSLEKSTESTAEKYFIVKSLTVEDLELSVRNGIWATQSHNEAALNEAYKSSQKVYLVFSANKSGEYFGYARMASAIDEESHSKIDWVPTAHPIEDLELPKAIQTVPTEFAPRGRIIDDSARGTIFWEAETHIDNDAVRDHDSDAGNASGRLSGEEAVSFNKASGKPFRIEWISTTRLPFYRTRGLRNPWNANREVKIARDGTELEPTAGRRLLSMFHRPGAEANQPPPHAGPIAGQYPHMQVLQPY